MDNNVTYKLFCVQLEAGEYKKKYEELNMINYE